MDERRYAIYFVPPADSALYRFGAGFLGYDCYTGERLRQPHDTALTASEWAQLTREPRRYGFHATLKAPFRLVPPFPEMDLTAGISLAIVHRGRDGDDQSQERDDKAQHGRPPAGLARIPAADQLRSPRRAQDVDRCVCDL